MGHNTLEFYTDEADKHRWRLTASNGEIIGASTQGYSEPIDCIKNMETVARTLMFAVLDNSGHFVETENEMD